VGGQGPREAGAEKGKGHTAGIVATGQVGRKYKLTQSRRTQTNNQTNNQQKIGRGKNHFVFVFVFGLFVCLFIFFGLYFILISLFFGADGNERSKAVAQHGQCPPLTAQWSGPDLMVAGGERCGERKQKTDALAAPQPGPRTTGRTAFWY